MSPAAALPLIPGFAGAAVIAQLSGGMISDSWLVDCDGARYVLRVDKDEARRLGLDRASERAAQAAVALAGLSPATVFHDIDRGVSLRPHVAGRAWTREDLQRPRNLDRLGVLLRDVHALPPAGQMFEPGVAARRYAQQLDTAQAQRLADEANVLLAELRFQPARECLCHNDLIAENLIDDGERLVPIDWEYAGIGDPLFDLAVVMQHHELLPEARGRLLNAYFRREATRAEALRLHAWCRFYRLLLKLWLLRVGDSAAGSS